MLQGRSQFLWDEWWRKFPQGTHVAEFFFPLSSGSLSKDIITGPAHPCVSSQKPKCESPQLTLIPQSLRFMVTDQESCAFSLLPWDFLFSSWTEDSAHTGCASRSRCLLVMITNSHRCNHFNTSKLTPLKGNYTPPRARLVCSTKQDLAWIM